MATKKAPYLDDTDKEILHILSLNGRISMKELGNRVHLTGQAVKNRVERLEQLGYIKHYTFNMNCSLYGYKIHGLVRTSIHFAKKNAFLQFIKTCGHPIIHCYQITGGETLTYWTCSSYPWNPSRILQIHWNPLAPAKYK